MGKIKIGYSVLTSMTLIKSPLELGRKAKEILRMKSNLIKKINLDKKYFEPHWHSNGRHKQFFSDFQLKLRVCLKVKLEKQSQN